MSLPRETTRNWVEEHRSGVWDFLASAVEQQRLALIAALARSHGSGLVADFGCGAGHLATWLDADCFGQYIGIDLAADAITLRPKAKIPTQFLTADIAGFIPPLPAPGAVVVFSECLYYLDAPAVHVARLARAYDAACTIVSMTIPSGRFARWGEQVDVVWRGLDALGWANLATLTLSDDGTGTAWRISALRQL